MISNWRSDAACTTAAPELFDGPIGSVLTHSDLTRIAAAQQICAGCPVKAECLEEATRLRDYGVRGGVLLNHGETIRTPEVGLAPCGTPAAYARHRRRNEPIDSACRRAHSSETLDRRHRRALAGAA